MKGSASMRRRTLLAFTLLSAVATRAEATPISVTQVWSRAAMAGRTGVVYLTITAAGVPDQLLSVSSPVAPKAELHESLETNGVMEMRAVSSLDVEPGKPVALRPGGYHIMLVGLKHALKEGDSFPLTLHFAKAGDITVTASVQKAGASGMQPSSDSKPGMKM
jgi:periplasmic copper chaperone A